MRLWAVKYMENAIPTTRWCATASEAAKLVRDLKAPAQLELRDLPSTGKDMAGWLNDNHVESWQAIRE